MHYYWLFVAVCKRFERARKRNVQQETCREHSVSSAKKARKSVCANETRFIQMQRKSVSRDAERIIIITFRSLLLTPLFLTNAQAFKLQFSIEFPIDSS